VTKDVFWKIRHKPTGLFFKLSKHRGKSNLSKVGRVYGKKPTLKYLGSVYYDPRDEGESAQSFSTRFRKILKTRPVDLSEWEIVRYKVVEDGVET
jgi:hypothetical protein